MNILGHQELTNLHETVNNVDEISDFKSNEISTRSNGLTDRLTATVSFTVSKLAQAIAACLQIYKLLLDIVGCVFPMVVVSVLSHAEFRPYDHREYVSHSYLTINNIN